jgi:hypothetical protein
MRSLVVAVCAAVLTTGTMCFGAVKGAADSSGAPTASAPAGNTGSVHGKKHSDKKKSHIGKKKTTTKKAAHTTTTNKGSKHAKHKAKKHATTNQSKVTKANTHKADHRVAKASRKHHATRNGANAKPKTDATMPEPS